MIKTLFSFKQVDPVAADSSLTKLKVHWWHLPEEMILLSLLDDKVP